MAFAWKNGCAAAVSLTFDDGMPSHLEVAIPALEEHGFRGTFFLMTGTEDRLTAFRSAQNAGHEIGNHSVRHICSSSGNPDPSYQGLESMDLDTMARELEKSDAIMRRAFPEVERFSFGYPCYNTFVGSGAARTSFVPLIAERFAAGRAGGEISTSFNSPYHCDIYCMNSWKCERKGASELIGIVERSIRLGAYSCLTFHGINEGHLAVFLPDFIELIEFLQSESRHVWVAPFLEVATHIDRMRRA